LQWKMKHAESPRYEASIRNTFLSLAISILGQEDIRLTILVLISEIQVVWIIFIELQARKGISSILLVQARIQNSSQSKAQTKPDAGGSHL
jgi:hypothetical protein